MYSPGLLPGCSFLQHGLLLSAHAPALTPVMAHFVQRFLLGPLADHIPPVSIPAALSDSQLHLAPQRADS